MIDVFDRTINYMRVSVTDRCNYRCSYCMPNGCKKVEMSKILTYEQILKVCEAATKLGISRFKITGGEPLVRLGCVDFIKSLKSMQGCDQVTLTTNGELLETYLPELALAGLDGINVSLDSLKPERFAEITGGGNLPKVLSAIDAAISAGIKTKINCVIRQNINDDEIESLAELAFDKHIPVRFIELMPIGYGDSDEGVDNNHVLQRISQRFGELIPDVTIRGNGPAKYYVSKDGDACIGFISAMHGSFCDQCNRIRLTSKGLIKQCLCYEDGIDIKPYLDIEGVALENAISEAISSKPKGHCFNENLKAIDHRLMSQIGG